MTRRRRTLRIAGGVLCAALLLLALILLLRPAGRYENEFARIDVGQGGLFTAAVKAPTEKRVRLSVQKAGGERYLYELDPAGRADTFSLTEGNGDYTVTVYEQTEGTRYLPRLTQPLPLALADETGPFLHPTQMVHDTESASAAELAQTLTTDLPTDEARLDALVDYIITELSYDTEWAASLQSGYIPALDAVLARGGGNCLDLATLLCAMLRTQGIPCKLVVGYAGDTYHAWIQAYIEGEWLHRDPTFLLSDPAYAETPSNYRAVFYY